MNQVLVLVVGIIGSAVISVLGLARTYQEAGRLPEAEECYKKAVAVRNVFTSSKYYTSCVEDYAVLLQMQGRNGEADEVLTKLKPKKKK